MKDRPDSQQELEEKMKATIGGQQEYEPWNDTRLWKNTTDGIMYILIFAFSGYIVTHAIDYFIDSDGSKTLYDKTEQRKFKMGKKIVSEGIYKNEEEIEKEFSKMKILKSDGKVFRDGKQTYFIQIEPDFNEFPELEEKYE